MAQLQISLVLWNGEKYLPACFESLLAQTFTDFTLLVIDNASTDASVAVTKRYLERFGGRMRLIQNTENLGFARAHNQGIAQCVSPLIMLLNQDMQIEPNYVAILMAFMEANPQVGSVSGALYRWDCRTPEGLNGGGKTAMIDSLGLKVFKNGRVIEQHAGEEDTGQWQQPMAVFGVSGALPLYRLGALQSIAFGETFFDEDFFMYKEDVDLAFRLRWAGYSSFVVPTAKAYHDRTASHREGLRFNEQLAHRTSKRAFINYHSYKNHLFVLAKNLQDGLAWRMLPRVVCFELIKALWILVREWGSLRAWLVFFKMLPATLAKRRQIAKTRSILGKEMYRWMS